MKKIVRIISALVLVAGLVAVWVSVNFGVVDIQVTFFGGTESVSYVRIPDEVMPGIIECHRREIAGELDEGATVKYFFANIGSFRWTTKNKRSSDFSFVLPRGLYAISLFVEKGGRNPVRDMRLVRVDRMWKSLDFTSGVYSLKETPIY